MDKYNSLPANKIISHQYSEYGKQVINAVVLLLNNA